MDVITINKLNYVQADDVIRNAPIFCKGIRNGREFVKKKIINSKHYIFAKSIDGKWVVSDGKSLRYDNVLIRKKYIATLEALQNELNGVDNVVDDDGTEKAPDIIDLADDEKFHDNEGNIVEIETRGERAHDGIYFRVRDVMMAFEMKSLSKNIQDEKSAYVADDDYKYFMRERICKVVRKSETKQMKKICEKELFLTYCGILKVLFSSQSKTAKKFIKWATETLFVAQMGSIEQKGKLCGGLLGTYVQVIKEVFDTAVHTVPCIYLFTLGMAKDLRESMKIDPMYPDDYIVCKYGFAKSLGERAGQHKRTFGRIKGADLKLKLYSYIDPQYISEAETCVRNLMKSLNVHLEYEKTKELIIVDKELFKTIEMSYDGFGKRYMGHISELVTRLKNLENDMEKLNMKNNLEMDQLCRKYETEISQLKIELREKEIELREKEIEFGKKEIELQKERHSNELQKEKFDNELLKKKCELLRRSKK
jgi:hypothetical protein